jgi:hydroxyacylglutathione hydrolase
VCGRRLSGKPSSTIGFERRYNAAFKIETEAEFVEFMLAGHPARTAGGGRDKGLEHGIAGGCGGISRLG